MMGGLGPGAGAGCLRFLPEGTFPDKYTRRRGILFVAQKQEGLASRWCRSTEAVYSLPPLQSSDHSA